MKNTIFFGNGLNLVSGSCPRWADLLAGISVAKEPILFGIPYTMQYEAIVLAEEAGRHTPSSVTKEKHGVNAEEPDIRAIAEEAVKEKIAAEMKRMAGNPCYKHLANLRAEKLHHHKLRQYVAQYLRKDRQHL